MIRLLELYNIDSTDESAANPFDPKPIGTVKKTDPGLGSMQMVGKPKVQMAPPDPEKLNPEDIWHSTQIPKPPAQPVQKPLYPGKFFGQLASMGKQRAKKNTSWIDRETAERRYGKIMGWGSSNDWVWDGKQWMKPNAFDHLYGKMKK